MNENRLQLVQAPKRGQVAVVESDVERVRRHVARIRMQIQDLERRTRPGVFASPALRAR